MYPRIYAGYCAANHYWTYQCGDLLRPDQFGPDIRPRDVPDLPNPRCIVDYYTYYKHYVGLDENIWELTPKEIYQISSRKVTLNKYMNYLSDKEEQRNKNKR